MAIFMVVWRGVRRGERKLWWALLSAGGVGFASAIGAHPLVGYMDFFHLLSALVGGLAFAAGITLLAGRCVVPSGPNRAGEREVLSPGLRS